MIKKIVIAVVALALVGGAAWYLLRDKASASDPGPQITNSKVQKSNLRVVVASTGRVVANLDVDIKCKASGEVTELPKDVSDPVKEGEVLLKLDPVDELRALHQSEISLSASQARLISAKQNLEVAVQTLATNQARANADLQSAQARAKDARAKADRVKMLLEKKLVSQEEADTAETAAVSAAMDLQNAQVKLDELKTQEVALETKRQDVKLAEAQVESDKTARDMANDRKNDTTVLARMDGVVTARTVQVGQIISSGVSNVGGGTAVLTLSDLSRIFVLASVDESDIGKVVVGQSADIKVDAFPGRVFDGRVVRIATRGVNTSNVVTFEVKIEVIGEKAGGGDPGRTGGMRGSRRGDRAGRPEGAPRPDATSRPDGAGTPDATSRPGGESPRGPRNFRRPEGQPPVGEGGAATQPMQRAGVEPIDMGAAEPMAGRIVPPGSQPSSQPSQQHTPLKPEMTANVEIIAMEKSDVLAVPVDAVVRKAGKMVATILKADGSTEERPVETGISDGVLLEVLAGVNDGETVQIRKNADSRWNANQRQQGGPPRGMMMPGGPGGGGGRR